MVFVLSKELLLYENVLCCFHILLKIISHLFHSLAPKVNLGRALPAKVVSEPQPSLSTQSQQEEEDKGE